MRIVWNGNGGDQKWGNPANWEPAKVPGDGDTAVIGDHCGAINGPEVLPNLAGYSVGTGSCVCLMVAPPVAPKIKPVKG